MHTARAQGPGKTGAPPLPPLCTILQNLGTAVLQVLTPTVSLGLMIVLLGKIIIHAKVVLALV